MTLVIEFIIVPESQDLFGEIVLPCVELDDPNPSQDFTHNL